MVMSTLKSKLKPTRFNGMSPLMAAIVGYVLGEAYTTPEIAEVTVHGLSASQTHNEPNHK